MPVIDLRAGALAEEDPQNRVIAATLRCMARWGITKTTLDDVAREAGLSRALAEMADGAVAGRLGAAAYADYWGDPLSVARHVERTLAVYRDLLSPQVAQLPATA